MLVLSRKKGESIMIGEGIEVIVLDVEGDTVKIGVRAPKQVDIFRKEVYNSIMQSNREASQPTGDLSQLNRLMRDKPHAD